MWFCDHHAYNEHWFMKTHHSCMHLSARKHLILIYIHCIRRVWSAVLRQTTVIGKRTTPCQHVDRCRAAHDDLSWNSSRMSDAAAHVHVLELAGMGNQLLKWGTVPVDREKFWKQFDFAGPGPTPQVGGRAGRTTPLPKFGQVHFSRSTKSHILPSKWTIW